MKKLFYSLNLLVLALLWIPVNAQQAMYIYRNDSVSFNAFMTDEIDSISYSVMDADSVEYEGYVSQLIYTKDSIHIIPLANIDSISFITPDPILKPDVRIMGEEYLPYVLAVDSNIITFSTNTPINLTPAIGDILVGDVYEDALEYGFSGKVLSIENVENGINYICEDVFITDVYERLVLVGFNVSSTQVSDDSTAVLLPRRTPSKDTKVFDLPVIPVEFKNFSMNVTPSIQLKYEIDIEPGKNRVVAFTFLHSYDWEASIKLSTESDDDEDEEDDGMKEKFFFTSNPIPLPVAGCVARVKLGGFIKMDGKIDVGLNLKGAMSFENGIRWDNIGATMTKRTLFNDFNPEESNVSIDMEGSFAFGVAAQLSAQFVSSRLFGASFSLYLGPQLAGNLAYKISPNGMNNGQFYESMKESALKLNLFLGLDLTFNFFDPAKFYTDIAECSNALRFPGERTVRIPLVDLSYQLNTWYLLPEFEVPVYSFNKNGAADFRILPKRNLIPFIPMSIGVSIFDEQNTKVVTEYYNEKYRLEKDWDCSKTLSITTLENNKNYTCSPAIKFIGEDMVATPDLQFTTGFPVSITKFSVTNATKNEDGFDYEGNKYYYKYETSVTVELSDNTNIEDWGYTYIDLDGDTARVSLADKESPYTDTRYVYYRNEAKSYARLGGYVKYSNENDYFYGLMNDYELLYDTLCIDLGLSVKWASMNIGATMPSDTGAYYAFAEVTTKNVFNQQSYSYCTYIPSTYGTNYAPIENDENPNLSGNPAYDAATATWGSGWRTPTLAEMDELVDNCEWLFTTQNNVQGYRVTGPNGNSIFLPLTGTITGSSIPTVIGSNTPKGAASYWTAEWAPQTTYTGTGHPYAWMLGCFATPTDPTAPDNIKVRSMNKFYGAQIRAVKDY
ncbi:MAG: hypothetical protein IJ249_00050 [Paludibacteraceae bacterium]|nr:hypothetical protein [Paludibacteraceae bacterium]